MSLRGQAVVGGSVLAGSQAARGEPRNAWSSPVLLCVFLGAAGIFPKDAPLVRLRLGNEGRGRGGGGKSDQGGLWWVRAIQREVGVGSGAMT